MRAGPPGAGSHRVATVFEVSVPTAKAWGAHLPARYAFQAEVLSNGRLRAPRA